MSYLLEVRVAALSAVVVLGLASVRAGDSVEPAGGEIDAQIQRLNSADFDTREAALASLRAMGATALEKAKATLEAAGDDQPELNMRLEALIHGPRVRQQSAATWIKGLKSSSYEDRIEAVNALESMGVAALPQVETLALDKDPYLRHAGMWLLAVLGEKANAAAPSIRKLLVAEMEYLDAHEISYEKENEFWSMYLHPRPNFGMPPIVDFHLGDKDGEAYSYPYDIMARLESVTYEHRRTCIVRPWSDFSKPYEGCANLRGTMLSYAYCPQDRRDAMKVLPSLSLKLLCYTLERVGPGGEGQALLKRANLKIVDLMSREMVQK
ncbi:MAG: hypothetical protein KIS92_09980 [Planctomycetota bacterium]|nr:hypothetical protein [Planctomycetota bacterium]